MRKSNHKLIAIIMSLLIQSNYALIAFASDANADVNKSSQDDVVPFVSENQENSSNDEEKNSDDGMSSGNDGESGNDGKDGNDDNKAANSENEDSISSPNSNDNLALEDNNNLEDNLEENSDEALEKTPNQESNSNEASNEENPQKFEEDNKLENEAPISPKQKIEDENQEELLEETKPIVTEAIEPKIDDLSYDLSFLLNEANANITINLTNSENLGNVTYSWYKSENSLNSDGEFIEQSKNVEFSIDTSSLGDSYYYCIITNSVANENEEEKTVSVTTNCFKVSVVAPEETDYYEISEVSFKDASYNVSDEAAAFSFKLTKKFDNITITAQLFQKNPDGDPILVGNFEEKDGVYYFSAPTEEVGSKAYYPVVKIKISDETEFIKGEDFFGLATIEVTNLYENLSFNELADGGYEFSDIKGETKDITVPDEYKGKPITKVSLDVLKKATGTLSLGKNINNIADNNFTNALDFNCSLSISEENNTYSVCESSLYNKDKTLLYFCKSKEMNIVLPDSLKEIADYAFNSINMDDKTINFGENLEKIGKYAFLNCRINCELVFPDSLKEIGDDAFFANTNISDVKFGSSLEKIGESAFENCDKIKSISLPSTMSCIGDNAFASCYSIENFSISPGGTNPIDIGYMAFSKDVNLKNVSLPKNIRKIGDYCFCYDFSLENVSFEKGETKERTTIGDYCFFNTINLNSITIPNYVEKIGDCAFYFDKDYKINTDSGPFNEDGWDDFINGCQGENYHTHLESVTIDSPAEIESYCDVGVYAFYNCYALKDLSLGEGVRDIGTYSFYKCSALEKINLPSTIEHIGYINKYPHQDYFNHTNYAFDLCSSNKAFTVAEGCKNYSSVDGVLYRNYDGSKFLTNYPMGDTERSFLAIADGTVRIGERAFQNSKINEILTSINTWEINKDAFSGCKNLKAIHFFSDGYGNSLYSSAKEYIWSSCGYLTPKGELIPPTLIKYTVPNLQLSVGQKEVSPISVEFLKTDYDSDEEYVYNKILWGKDTRNSIKTNLSYGIDDLSEIEKVWSRDYVSSYKSVKSSFNKSGKTSVIPPTDKAMSYGLFCLAEKTLPSGETIKLRTLGFIPTVTGEEIQPAPVTPPKEPVAPPSEPEPPTEKPNKPKRPHRPHTPHEPSDDEPKEHVIIDENPTPLDNKDIITEEDTIIIDDEETPLANLPLTGGKTKAELLLAGISASIFGIVGLKKSNKNKDGEEEK